LENNITFDFVDYSCWLRSKTRAGYALRRADTYGTTNANKISDKHSLFYLYSLSHKYISRNQKVVTATKTLTPTLTPTATLTPTPINSPTPTTPPTATFTTWQLTSEAVKATNDFFAQYSYVNQKDFLTYPDKLDGEKIKIQCRIFNVVDTKSIQCYISGTYDAFYVDMKNKFDNLYEDDRITIYGIGDGEHCFTNRMGNLTCQPLLSDSYFTKP